MLFSSVIFLFYFFPATILVYWALSFSRTCQNMWLLLVSLAFYAWGEPFFVLVMILSIFVNWFLGLMVDRYRGRAATTKFVLAVCVVFNIGILFVYKYLGFMVGNINAVLDYEFLRFEPFLLPVGISFFTFQAMSYVLDVHRLDARVDRNPFYVGLYIALFPQLVAGPIVRYADIAEQLRNRVLTWTEFSGGCSRFVIGLGKKIFIANAMGAVSDRIFDLSAAGGHVVFVPAMLAWLGVVAYTLQIYFDFSSYSDMAIGLGHMFGFTFKENFNFPYISRSITEFWRRWHISLSTWFREYLYFPLGGSRPENVYGPMGAGKRSAIIIRNLFAVWICTGIWHGADWTFILWGMWHFVFIMFERMTKFASRKIPPVVAHIYVMTAAMIGWMFFRAGGLRESMVYLSNMFGINDNGVYSKLAVTLLRENWLFFLLAVVFSTPFARNLGDLLKAGALGRFWGTLFSAAYPALLTIVYVVSVVYLAKGTYTPFIYFNF